jgi:16S rRNA (guanine527-N7)-methyltransferase
MKNVDPPMAFRTICLRNGVVLSGAQLALMSAFVSGVLGWNAKINLISRRDEENIWFSHVLHSLSLFFFAELPQGARVLDLGTGGGFPGIPIAIARPDIEMVLLDSIRKKTNAVQDILGSIHLGRVSVWAGRAEEVYRKEGASAAFDVVVARAVASMRDLVHWSRPYLKRSAAAPPVTEKGKRIDLSVPCLVALKGGDLESEISETKAKENVRFIQVIRMSFDGCTELGLEDKKAVIACL